MRRGADASYARGRTEELLEKQMFTYQEVTVTSATKQRNVVPSHTVLNANEKIRLKREI